MEKGKIGRNARFRRRAALGVAAASVGFLYVYFVDPATSPFAPPCLFTAIFGIHCPGCGSLRALHALAHGNPKAALEFNATLVIALPVAALLFFIPLLRRSLSSSSSSSFPPPV